MPGRNIAGITFGPYDWVSGGIHKDLCTESGVKGNLIHKHFEKANHGYV